MSLVLLVFEPHNKWLAKVRKDNSAAFEQILTKQSEM